MSSTPSRDQWLVAGQELLRRGGIGEVKLSGLTAELGLTTGSFYHSFPNMAGYLDALARFYGTEQPHSLLDSIDDDDPRRRLRELYDLAMRAHRGSLDAAMRDWAADHDVAAEAVREADAVLLRFVERAFRDMGCDDQGARVRAQLFVSVGVARLTPPWPLDADPFDAFLDALSP